MVTSQKLMVDSVVADEMKNDNNNCFKAEKVSQNLETLMTTYNMEVPPEYRIQGGIHKSTLLKNCTEMCRLVEGSGSATEKKVLKNLLALAKDYTELKGFQNRPNDSRLS
uniref:GBP_C domain-containing protein n=1 Tax=Strongyloides venezuelensis TaxID=75913 RepID=A0A0K0FEE6_STRVS